MGKRVLNYVFHPVAENKKKTGNDALETRRAGTHLVGHPVESKGRGSQITKPLKSAEQGRTSSATELPRKRTNPFESAEQGPAGAHLVGHPVANARQDALIEQHRLQGAALLGHELRESRQRWQR